MRDFFQVSLLNFEKSNILRFRLKKQPKEDYALGNNLLRNEQTRFLWVFQEEAGGLAEESLLI
jgi:hypothetical protein